MVVANPRVSVTQSITQKSLACESGFVFYQELTHLLRNRAIVEAPRLQESNVKLVWPSPLIAAAANLTTVPGDRSIKDKHNNPFMCIVSRDGVQWCE